MVKDTLSVHQFSRKSFYPAIPRTTISDKFYFNICLLFKYNNNISHQLGELDPVQFFPSFSCMEVML